MAGATAAIVVMAGIVWIVFGAAERIGDRIGPAASRTITRLFAFLLICIGVQILVNGIEDVLRPFLLDTLRAAGVGAP
jgi:multiple antibiotic resistance protein